MFYFELLSEDCGGEKRLIWRREGEERQFALPLLRGSIEEKRGARVLEDPLLNS